MPFRDRFQSCPHCATTLRAFTAAGCSIQLCGECRGAWVEHGALTTMFANMRWDAKVQMSMRATIPHTDNVSLAFTFETPDGTSVHTTDREIIKIGRLESCHLRIDHPSVSRMHAVIEFEGPERIQIIDLGSTSGTHVAGQKINSATLFHGSLVRFGDVDVAVSIVHPSDSASSDARQCLTCQKAMAAMYIERIPVDVCDDHGIWFDADELQQVLQRAAE